MDNHGLKILAVEIIRTAFAQPLRKRGKESIKDYEKRLDREISNLLYFAKQLPVLCEVFHIDVCGNVLCQKLTDELINYNGGDRIYVSNSSIGKKGPKDVS